MTEHEAETMLAALNLLGEVRKDLDDVLKRLAVLESRPSVPLVLAPPHRTALP